MSSRGIERLCRKHVPELVKQEDCTTRFIENSEKTCVTYGFGGIWPLMLAEIIEINLQEYDFAVAALVAYSDLMREALPQISGS